MSERHGAVWWTELMTPDPAAARAYYGDVCGWSFEEMQMETGGVYHVGRHGDRPVIGIFDTTPQDKQDEGATPARWMSYFAVDDVDAAVALTRARGGRIHREPWDVPGVGRIAIVSDPAGAAMGLIAPADGEQMAG